MKIKKKEETQKVKNLFFPSNEHRSFSGVLSICQVHRFTWISETPEKFNLTSVGDNQQNNSRLKTEKQGFCCRLDGVGNKCSSAVLQLTQHYFPTASRHYCAKDINDPFLGEKFK